MMVYIAAEIFPTLGSAIGLMEDVAGVAYLVTKIEETDGETSEDHGEMKP